MFERNLSGDPSPRFHSESWNVKIVQILICRDVFRRLYNGKEKEGQDILGSSIGVT